MDDVQNTAQRPDVARRNDHARDELRTLAANAASRVLEAEGREALTARRVAEAIGYAPGTLYNVFDGMDALAAAAAEERLAGLRQNLEDLADDRSREPRRRLGDMARACLAFAEREPAVWGLLFDAGSTPGGAEAPHALLAASLEAGVRPFAEDASEARRDAAVFAACVRGLGAVAAMGERIGPEASAERFVATYFGAPVAPPGSAADADEDDEGALPTHLL